MSTELPIIDLYSGVVTALVNAGKTVTSRIKGNTRPFIFMGECEFTAEDLEGTKSDDAQRVALKFHAETEEDSFLAALNLIKGVVDALKTAGKIALPDTGWIVLDSAVGGGSVSVEFDGDIPVRVCELRYVYRLMEY